jgi:hypothetical protein
MPPKLSADEGKKVGMAERLEKSHSARFCESRCVPANAACVYSSVSSSVNGSKAHLL